MLSLQRAQLLHCSFDLLQTQCSAFIWHHSSPRMCVTASSFPTSSLGTEAMGPSKCWAKKLATDLQSKRNGKLLN